MEKEGLVGPKLIWIISATAGYLHDSRQKTPRLGTLDPVGLYHFARDLSLAVLQAAVQG